MELDKTKLQEVVEKIAYQQTAEDQADDLFNKMGVLNEYVQEQLALHNVSQQRELLKAYAELIQSSYTHHFFDDALEESIDEFLSL